MSATTLTVYRPLEVRHPITGKRVRNRFAIGVLRVVQPDERLSIAHAVDKPRHAFAVRDRSRAPVQRPRLAGYNVQRSTVTLSADVIDFGDGERGDAAGDVHDTRQTS